MKHQKVPQQRHHTHTNQITSALTSGLSKFTANRITSKNNKHHAKHTKPGSQSNTRKTKIRQLHGMPEDPALVTNKIQN